ncbi:hypothetical protein B0O80DRAFT_427726 [Mortierella sp. GBAus27b]|nr:hypothetical protein B0O80DRAFT_427726 [Mortierella sp. GBAus27b]
MCSPVRCPSTISTSGLGRKAALGWWVGLDWEVRQLSRQPHDHGEQDQIRDGGDKGGGHDPESRRDKRLPLVKDISCGPALEDGDPEHSHAKGDKDDSDFEESDCIWSCSYHGSSCVPLLGNWA